MAATLGDIRTMQDEYLANSKTGNFSETERTRAINQAFNMIWRYGNWPQLKTSADVSFTLGTGSLPSDFFIDTGIYPLYLEGDNNQRNTIYKKVNQEDFLNQIPNTFTIDSGELKIYSADTTTLKLHYIKKSYTTALSVSTDSTGMDAQFDEPAAMISAGILTRNKNKGNRDASFLLYGQNGSERMPEEFSAFGILNGLFVYYKRLYSSKQSRFKYPY